MKRTAAFLLLILYLCVSTEAYQLLRVPTLISHYITHCQKEPGTTLRSFLLEHYSGKMVYDEDWQQDMELPFKCCECTPLTFPATLNAEVLELKLPQIVEVRIAYPIRDLFFQSEMLAHKIFQPPRV